MRNSSFVIKALFIFILAAAAFLVVVFLVFFPGITNDGIAEQARHMRRHAELLDEGVRERARTGESGALRAWLAAKAGPLDARLTYVRPDGTVLADTAENPAYMENHAGRPEIARALAGEDNYTVRRSATLGKDMLYVAHPVRDGGRVSGVLRLSMTLAALESLMAGLKLQYLLVIGALAAAAAAAIVSIHLFFRREIDRFSLISRRVAEGDFNVEFSGSESREIRDLSKSFSAMVAKIRRLIADLTAEKNGSASIIAAVDEGIAVIDGRDLVVRANESFSRMFRFSDPVGRHLWEIVRNNDVIALVKRGRATGLRAVPVEHGDRTLLASLSRLPEREDIVLVFTDVTAVRNWETMKKDLVTNVSHELGTPLTAIKGYVETLIDEEGDERKRGFLSIIARHAERLERIVKELLTLSALESGREPAPAEPVRLPAALANVFSLFRERAGSKGLAFTVRAPEDLPEIAGDAFRLEQAFSNLLDNAVKYTERGGLEVAFSSDGRSVKAEIRDTGIGIPEADRDRVFERFYVVDKSRSRAQGGTGLGLSIVKHIVALHHGTIAVESRPGAGSTFTLTFPAL